MLALLAPMVVLYEVGILAAKVFIKHTQAPDEDAAATPS
jgi:sec-independent protein translocase protein TatC